MNTQSVLLSELNQLKGISEGAVALMKYAMALSSSEFEHEGQRWVFRPENFVTFEVHCQRSNNLTVTLRGDPSEFQTKAELPLDRSMNGYSAFKLTENGQLEAAFSYVRRAKELFDRGRTRDKKTPQVIER